MNVTYSVIYSRDSPFKLQLDYAADKSILSIECSKCKCFYPSQEIVYVQVGEYIKRYEPKCEECRK